MSFRLRGSVGSAVHRVCARPACPAINQPSRKLEYSQFDMLHNRAAVERRRQPDQPTHVCAASQGSEGAVEAPKPSYGSVYLSVAVACCGAFSFGYHLGVLNGPLQQIAVELGIASNASLQGFIVSISLAGAAVGSLAGSGLADSLGRKKTFILDAFPLLIGSVLCAIATTPATMLAGRALVGVGIGLASALVPLYISEAAPKDIRGALGSLNQLMICVGILAALVVNVVLPVDSWRTMFWLATIPAGLLFMGMLVCPETPAFLKSKGKRMEAEDSARQLWGSTANAELYGDSMPDGVEGVGGRAFDAAKSPDSEAVSWGEMFSGLNGKLVAICCMLFVIQQFSGINAVVYFSSSVFREAGLQNEALASAAVGAINVLGTLLAASLMDKQGGPLIISHILNMSCNVRKLLQLSYMGQGLSMLAMAAALALPALQPYAGPVALIGTLLYVLAFAIGCGPVPGLLCAELLPIAIRGRGVSLALGVHWICNFALGQLFLTSVAQFGVSGVYCFFASVCAFGILFVSKSIVETKGKTPEQIAALMK